jgi:hypothetical protein
MIQYSTAGLLSISQLYVELSIQPDLCSAYFGLRICSAYLPGHLCIFIWGVNTHEELVRQSSWICELKYLMFISHYLAK